MIANSYGRDIHKMMMQAWDTAFNPGNSASLAAMCADDARFVTGSGTVKRRPSEIEVPFQSFIESGSPTTCMSLGMSMVRAT